VEVCGKRVTLADELNTRRSADGTEEADGMLSGQRFGPGGNTTPECWIDGRRMRAAPNARAIAEEAMPSKLGQSGVSS